MRKDQFHSCRFVSTRMRSGIHGLGVLQSAASRRLQDKSLLHNVNEQAPPFGRAIRSGSLRTAFALGDLAVEKWWSQTESNRRPQACKASALPTELWPRRNNRIIEVRTDCKCAGTLAAHQASRALAERDARRMVGLGRVELPTSRLSSARSNQLSYRP